MFSPNPSQRALAIMAYAGIILGVIVLFAASESIPGSMIGALILLTGILALIGGLVLAGIKWRPGTGG